MRDLIVIGGGAAGIFAAIAAKEANPLLKVSVLEKSALLLAKVKISGGGRCNVTHGCFDPLELVKFYPRGHKELLGPFYRFQPRDIIEWFEKKGVFLKTESDGRIFPLSNSSNTITTCLLKVAAELNIEIRIRQKIARIEKKRDFHIYSKDELIVTKHLLLATGNGAEGYLWAQQLGHTIQQPVPSLFTFNISNFALHSLSGIALPAIVKLSQTKFTQKGALLITHFGFSGPAILKLSAWAARFLYEKNYCAEVVINWLPDYMQDTIFQILKNSKSHQPQKSISLLNPFKLPKNFWRVLLEESADLPLLSLSDKFLKKLAAKLHADSYFIDGKTTHKEEFVTCGGVTLSEVDFKTLQSKICSGLFFAGEILDIDGVTGGFNFQNAWTTAFIAGNSQ